MYRKSKALKKDLFDLLLSMGENPDNLEGSLSIICNGIKFTKKISNGNAVYNVEDTHTFDNYYEINNYFLLKLIFENFKSKQSDNR